jgi:hypothetical protein
VALQQRLFFGSHVYAGYPSHVISLALQVGQSVHVFWHVSAPSQVDVPSNVKPQTGLAWHVGHTLHVFVHVGDMPSHVFEPSQVNPLLHVIPTHSGQAAWQHVY